MANELAKVVETQKSDRPGLFSVSRHDHHAAALETCAAAFRAAPFNSQRFVFLLPARAFWKNHLV